MTKLSLKHVVLLLCMTTAFSINCFAQKYEVHALWGRTLPLKWADAYNLKSSDVFGVKGAMYTNHDTQVEGEFSYAPQFDFRGTDPKIRALIWGANVVRTFTLPNSKAIPFYTFGLGGITAHVPGGTASMVLPTRTVTIDDKDTFFTVNFGVGVKAMNVIGPVGLRANIYGRTMPNYFGRANSWAEITGGVVFGFGTK